MLALLSLQLQWLGSAVTDSIEKHNDVFSTPKLRRKNHIDTT